MKKCFERKLFILFLIMECFINNTSQLNFGKYSIYIVCVLGLIILLKRIVFDREYLFDKKYFVQYLMILSLIISSVINNVAFQYNNLVLLTIYTLMLFVVSNFSIKEDLGSVVDEFVLIARVTTILHLLYSIASIINAIIINDFEIKGLLGYSYYYAYNSVTIIGLALFLFLFEKNKIFKYGQLCNLLLHLIIIFFTQSRTSYLAILVSVMFVIYIMIKSKLHDINLETIIKNLCVVVVILPLFIVLLSLITPLSFSKAFYKVVNKRIFTISILSYRDIIWKVAIKAYMTGNLLLGPSAALLPSIITNYINASISLTEQNKYPLAYAISRQGYLHNVFIQQLCSYGLFGLVTMLIYIYCAIRKYIRLVRLETYKDNVCVYMTMCFSFIFIAQIVIAFFDDNIFFNIVYICNVFFFYSVGLINYFYSTIIEGND